MSVKRKKAGLVISWQKSFSLLAPWRKGKGDRDAVLDREVVLTKMKLFSNFHKMLPTADDSASTISTVSVSEQDIGDPTKASEVHKPESGSEHMSVISSDSQLTRLYKFESEDSGVELPSGTNSPSTLTSSEQSFIVHSRESSCNLNSDPGTLPDELVPFTQLSEIKQALDSVSPPVDTLDNVFIHSEELSSAAGEDVDGDQSGGTGISPERDEEMPGQLEETCAVTERTCFKGDSIDTTASGFGPEPPRRRRSDTSDSLEEYMDQCCRLSEAQQASCNPLGSGLDYLDHICQLIARIGQLQENNLQLERQICSLQKDGRMAKTKEDFFQHHCSCGAACLTFQHIPKRQSRSDFSSLSGTLSDLSTIHEVSRPSLLPARGDMSSAGLTPVPLWRTSLYRRSYTEGDVPFLGYSTEQRRPSENYTWGRVKDLVRKTKVKNQSRLRLTSASLKRSCPQLYMPDVEPFEPACRNRNSMIALGHHSKLDIPWLQ